MATKFRLSSLIPAGLIVERSHEDNGVIIVSAQAAADQRSCPLCNLMSDRVHSRYVRIVADLHCGGTKVQLRLSARRFICEMTLCRCRIFVERFGELIVPERSRRTARLDAVVHHLELALEGRSAVTTWFKTLLNDRQLLLGCPPPAANITCRQINVSILVRHKPVLKPMLEPFCLCRLSGRNGVQFMQAD